MGPRNGKQNVSPESAFPTGEPVPLFIVVAQTARVCKASSQFHEVK
jgi:hypothetical protein